MNFIFIILTSKLPISAHKQKSLLAYSAHYEFLPWKQGAVIFIIIQQERSLEPSEAIIYHGITVVHNTVQRVYDLFPPNIISKEKSIMSASVGESCATGLEESCDDGGKKHQTNS